MRNRWAEPGGGSARASVVLAGMALLAGACTDPSAEVTGDRAPGSSDSSDSSDLSTRASPTPLPEGDLPAALDLAAVGGRTVRAEPSADFAVASGRSVWVSGVTPGLVRYDAESGRVTARVRVDGLVTQALEHAGGEVLVPVSALPPVLLRVVARTGEVAARIGLPDPPSQEGVVGGAGDTAYVLVGSDSPRIVEVVGDRVTRTLPTPDLARGVRAAYGSLWVPTGDDTVVRIGMDDGRRTAVRVGPGPRFLDDGFGAVWVMNQGDGSITRIDAATEETERIPVTGREIGGGDLTCGAGAVWLRTDEEVLRLDPRTRRVTHRITLPPGSGSVAATPTSLVITNHDHLAIHVVPLPLPD